MRSDPPHEVVLQKLAHFRAGNDASLEQVRVGNLANHVSDDDTVDLFHEGTV